MRQIKELQAQGVEFCLFIEDWAPVAEYITEQTDIPVLGVNPFDEGSTLVTKDQLAVVLDEHPACSNADWVEPEVLAGEIFPRLGGAF